MGKQETFDSIFDRMRQKMGTHKASEIVGTAIIQYSQWTFQSPLHAVMRVLYDAKKRGGYRSRYADEKLETIAFGAVETRSYKPKSSLAIEVDRINYINNLHDIDYGLDLILSGQAEDYKREDSRASLVCARIADSIGASEVQYANGYKVDRSTEVKEALHDFFALCTDRQLSLVQKAVQAYKEDKSVKGTLGSSYRSLALATKQVGLTPTELCEVYLRACV